MYKQIKIRLYLLKELWTSGEFLSALRHKVFSSAEAVPVRKDLSDLKPVKTPVEHTNLELIEITPDNYKNHAFHFTHKSRETRVNVYLKKGYRCFGLSKEGQIIGHIWYVTNTSANDKTINSTLKKFTIKLENDDVYLFDMFMTSDERGKALTTYFLSRVLEELRDRGYKNAYGFYYMGNIPALWVHRILGYKELPHYSIKKYFAYRIIKPIDVSSGRVSGNAV